MRDEHRSAEVSVYSWDECRFGPSGRSRIGRVLRVVFGVTLLALLTGLIGLLFMGTGLIDAMSFDSYAWRAAGPGGPGVRTIRARMSKSLLENTLKRGMTRDEVMELLGAPDGFLEGVVPSDPKPFYHLGLDGSLILPRNTFIVFTFENGSLVRTDVGDD